MIISPIHAVGNTFSDHQTTWCCEFTPALFLQNSLFLSPLCAESCVTLAHRILLVLFLFFTKLRPPFHICALSWNSRLSSSRLFPSGQPEPEIRRNPEFRDPPQTSPPPHPPFLDTRGPAALTEFPSGEVRGEEWRLFTRREERGIRREMREGKGSFLSSSLRKFPRFDVSWTPSFDCLFACDSILVATKHSFLALSQFRLLPGSPIPAPVVRCYGCPCPSLHIG